MWHLTHMIQKCVAPGSFPWLIFVSLLMRNSPHHRTWRLCHVRTIRQGNPRLPLRQHLGLQNVQQWLRIHRVQLAQAV
jgi:hypothetical protein